MFFSCDDVLPVSRAKPASRIDLGQGKLVWQLDFLKRAVAQNFVITNPAAVNIQSNPDRGEDCKCPACFPNFARGLQVETVKRQLPCPEQSPRFQSQKSRDRGATERHQKRDQRVNTANRQKTSEKYEYASDFLGPSQRIISLNCV